MNAEGVAVTDTATPASIKMIRKLLKIIFSIIKGITVFIIFIMMIAVWSFLDEK
jgi:heme/copper-type cytochrome/quinol oxidase subunit 2